MIGGLSLGFVRVFIAVGYSLIYSTLLSLNFARGGFRVIEGYIRYFFLICPTGLFGRFVGEKA
jgi:branched-chain amino acid transport system permease protein